MSGVGAGAGSLLALIVALSLIGLYGSPGFLARCLFRPYWYLRQREYSTALLAGFVHADLPLSVAGEARPVLFKDIEKQAILGALKDNSGNRTRTARQLGISLRTLQYRLKEYGVTQGG